MSFLSVLFFLFYLLLCGLFVFPSLPTLRLESGVSRITKCHPSHTHQKNFPYYFHILNHFHPSPIASGLHLFTPLLYFLFPPDPPSPISIPPLTILHLSANEEGPAPSSGCSRFPQHHPPHRAARSLHLHSPVRARQQPQRLFRRVRTPQQSQVVRGSARYCGL
jgi:hypothetical protein